MSRHGVSSQWHQNLLVNGTYPDYALEASASAQRGWDDDLAKTASAQ
jgi:hypothetical protein